MPLFSTPAAEGWVAIVDDDESIRQSLTRVFRIHGLCSKTFASAEEYLDRAPGTGPGCIVLDVHLPGLSGFELRDRLEGEGIAPPIIFITALDETTLAQFARGSERRDYLRKPFDTGDLVALVRQHVGTESANPAR
jgi:FixJ family two-component response regulator